MLINSISNTTDNTLLNQNLQKKLSIAHNIKTLSVWEVAKPILSESFSAIALNLGVMTFFATPVSIPILTASVVTSLVLSGLLTWRDAKRQPKNFSNITQQQLSTTQLIARGSLVNVMGLSNPNIFIHESGHFWMAKLLFKHSNPKVWVSPFQGGVTSYTASTRLTGLGQLFGKSGSMLVTAASGLVASTLFVCSELAVAHKIRKTRPNLSQYMNLHAITHLFNEVIYGLMAFVASKKDLGHDLVHLWRVGGIHPAIPICAMIALPLIETCLLKLIP